MSSSSAIIVSDSTLLGVGSQIDSPLSRLDRLGILISSLCLAHCLALPLVIVLLPTFAEVLPPDFWVHLMLIGVAFPITGFALLRGYLARRNPRPTLLGAIGLGLVAWGLFAAAPVAGVALTVVGGLLVAGAHILNMRDYRVRCVGDLHTHG